MDPHQTPEERTGRDPESPRKDYLGRILIGFVVLAAILWILTYLF